MNCPKCNTECEGEDLGDHPGWLDYWCEECGETWGDDREGMDRLADMADNLRKAQMEGQR